MKYFLVALLALLAVAAVIADERKPLSEEQKERIRTLAAECREQEDVTSEQVQSLREGHFHDVDPKATCFVNCLLEKVGFVINGVIQPDVVAAKLTPLIGAEKVAKVAKECNGVNNYNEKCLTSFELYECYYHYRAAFL